MIVLGLGSLRIGKSKSLLRENVVLADEKFKVTMYRGPIRGSRKFESNQWEWIINGTLLLVISMLGTDVGDES